MNFNDKLNLSDIKDKLRGLFQKKNTLEPAPETPVSGERGIPQLASGRRMSSAFKKAGWGLGIVAAVAFAYQNTRSAVDDPHAGGSQREEPEPERTATSSATRFIVGDAPPAPAAPPAPKAEPEPYNVNVNVKGDEPPPVSHQAVTDPPPKDEIRERRLKSSLNKQRGDEREPRAPGMPGAPQLPADPNAPVQVAALGNQTGYSGEGGSRNSEGELSGRLRTGQYPAANAYMLPDRTFMMTKGMRIDCALENALDSTLPGIVTCIQTEDVYGADGKVVLLERGTRHVGEYASNVKQGQARIFVTWARAETPKGVLVNVSSPGTDALGRAGVEGWVDNHFWERFGGAILLSLIDDAVAGARANSNGNGYDPYANTRGAVQSSAGIALENSINIPPTIRKNQGDHIQIIVARDLDFRGVYGLESRSR